MPPNQGSIDWNDIDYAATWPTGNAPLGYGDSDETTVINSNTLTAYFRHSFNVSNPSSFNAIDLNLIYDDGAVIYLNGTEVWRVNMPSGDITYDTFASSSSGDDASASTNILNTFLAGSNVLAVEVHQRSAGSSDISFDFKLSANVPGAVNVVRGPYLQKASPTSMVVRWRTAAQIEGF